MVAMYEGIYKLIINSNSVVNGKKCWRTNQYVLQHFASNNLCGEFTFSRVCSIHLKLYIFKYAN